MTSGGAGGGGGHTGIGGKGILGDLKSEGGGSYGNSELPCELGSGGCNPGPWQWELNFGRSTYW